MAEWKFGSGRRKKMKNNMQSKNLARPMAAQLKRRAGHKGVIGKDEIHFMISLLVVSPGEPEMKPGPSGDFCHL